MVFGGSHAASQPRGAGKPGVLHSRGAVSGLAAPNRGCSRGRGWVSGEGRMKGHRSSGFRLGWGLPPELGTDEHVLGDGQREGVRVATVACLHACPAKVGGRGDDVEMDRCAEVERAAAVFLAMGGGRKAEIENDVHVPCQDLLAQRPDVFRAAFAVLRPPFEYHRVWRFRREQLHDPLVE